MNDHPIKALGDMLRKAAKPRKREPGELDAYGRCPDCGLNWVHNTGVYFCERCSEDE